MASIALPIGRSAKKRESCGRALEGCGNGRPVLLAAEPDNLGVAVQAHAWHLLPECRELDRLDDLRLNVVLYGPGMTSAGRKNP
jgi:hypothetical protein